MSTQGATPSTASSASVTWVPDGSQIGPGWLRGHRR